MKQYKSTSEKETKEFAKKFAKEFKGGIIALTGELGAGKTTFVQGFAQGLGIKGKIISPTFILIKQHQIPKSSRMLFHVDLYRLEDNFDIKSLGLDELWSNPENIVLIEWANKIEKLLPEGVAKISIHKEDENNRVITLT